MNAFIISNQRCKFNLHLSLLKLTNGVSMSLVNITKIHQKK